MTGDHAFYFLLHSKIRTKKSIDDLRSPHKRTHTHTIMSKQI